MDPAAALSRAERAIRYSPLSARVREQQGDVFERLGDYEHARIAWREAILCRPSATLYHKLGCCSAKVALEARSPSLREAALSEARAHLSHAIKLYDSRQLDEKLRCHAWLGRVLAADGQVEESISHLAIAEGLPVEGTFASLLLADAYIRSWQHERGESKAREVMAIAERLEQTSPDLVVAGELSIVAARPRCVAHLARCLLARSMAERDASIDDAERVLAARQPCPRVGDADEGQRCAAALARAKGALAYRRAEYEQAITYFERVLASEVTADAYLYLSRCHVELSNGDSRERARRAIRNVRALDIAGAHTIDLAEIEARLSMNGSG